MPRLQQRIHRFHEALRNWCHARNPWGRAVLLAWLVYIGVNHAINAEYASLFFWLSAPIHEAGHFIVGVTGWEFLTVAAGTGFQLAAPVAAAINFVRQRDYFAIAVCGVWQATNLYHVAAYMADSRSQSMPFFRPFGMDPTIHDWNYMLSHVGLLAWDTTLAGCVSVAAFVLMWASILSAAYLLWLMIRLPANK